MFFRYLLAFALVVAVVTQNEPKMLSYLDGIFLEWLDAESNQTFFQNKSSELRDMCKQSKMLSELPKAERALQDTVQCLKQSFDANYLKKEIQKADTEQKAREFFCNIKSSLMLCYRKMINSFKICMHPFEHGHLIWSVNLAEAFADSVCIVDIERFEKYIALNETKCMEKKTAAIQTCAKNTTTELLRYENSLFGLFSRLRFHFKENECSQISGFQTCVTPIIEECSPGMKIIELLFNDIRRAVKCQVEIHEGNLTKTKDVPKKSSTSSREIFEDNVLDVTSLHFSKIIEKELSEIPKKIRIDCMQEILGVLKKYVI